MKAFAGLTFAFVAVAGVGCGNGDGVIFRSRFGHLPQSVEAACPSEPVPKPDYLSDVQLFRVRVSGPGINAPIERDFAVADAREKARLELDQIPIGAERDIVVSGMLGKVTLWRGAHDDVLVEAGQTQEVSVLMTRLAAMTCTRTPQTAPRVFASATKLADGRVLVAGGFFQIGADTSCAGCRRYVATATAEIYDPFKGTFRAVGDMQRARGLHKAVLLADGRVMIVGGAAELQHDPAASFPLLPAGHAVNIELYDPKSEAFVAGPDEPEMVARVFHTTTVLPDGRVLIAGGGRAVTATDAERRTTLCEPTGDSVACVSGPPMTYHRVGHTATLLADGRVFFWGGVTDSGEVGGCDNVAVTQCPEWFHQDEDAFVVVNSSNPVSGAHSANNLFFATAVSLEPYGMLISGGVQRADGSATLNLNPPTEADAFRTTFIYSPEQGRIGNSVGSGPPFTLRASRMMMQSTPLAVEGRAFFAGGYLDFNLTPSRDFEIYDIGAGGFLDDITVEGAPVLLRQPRGGVALVHTGGGAVVAIGGEDSDGSGGRKVLDTAEIFTDKVEPQP